MSFGKLCISTSLAGFNGVCEPVAAVEERGAQAEDEGHLPDGQHGAEDAVVVGRRRGAEILGRAPAVEPPHALGDRLQQLSELALRLDRDVEGREGSLGGRLAQDRRLVAPFEGGRLGALGRRRDGAVREPWPSLPTPV